MAFKSILSLSSFISNENCTGICLCVDFGGPCVSFRINVSTQFEIGIYLRHALLHICHSRPLSSFRTYNWQNHRTIHCRGKNLQIESAIPQAQMIVSSRVCNNELWSSIETKTALLVHKPFSVQQQFI